MPFRPNKSPFYLAVLLFCTFEFLFFTWFLDNEQNLSLPDMTISKRCKFCSVNDGSQMPHRRSVKMRSQTAKYVNAQMN